MRTILTATRKHRERYPPGSILLEVSLARLSSYVRILVLTLYSCWRVHYKLFPSHLGSSTGYKSQLWHPGWYLRFCFPDHYSVADVWREDATEERRIAFSDRLRSVSFISKTECACDIGKGQCLYDSQMNAMHYLTTQPT